MQTITVNSTVCCGWCGKSLSGATQVVYLNGNQPICDLCLMKANQPRVMQYKDRLADYQRTEYNDQMREINGK